MKIKRTISKIIIVVMLVISIFWYRIDDFAYAQESQTQGFDQEKPCSGIKLNTDVPFIGRCITISKPGESSNWDITPTSAFPRLMWGLTKIMMTFILSISFLLVIVAGVMMVVWWANKQYYDKGMKLLKIVVTALAVLGVSGIVLRLINPNFFWI